MSIDLKEKFQHLLQPLRDLADNWQVDIAKDLEEYLDQLEGITFSFDDGGKALNFAQAALLIQGSACVYSKKVEYLYNLAYQALEFITARKKAKQQEENGENGRTEAEEEEEETEFLSLDDIPIATNIDLDEDKERERQKGHTKPFTFGLCCLSTLPASNSNSNNNNVNTTSSDFQMSACLIHRNGALVLESTAGNDDWFSSPLSSSTAEQQQVVKSPLIIGGEEDFDDNQIGDENGTSLQMIGEQQIDDKSASTTNFPVVPDQSAFDSANQQQQQQQSQIPNESNAANDSHLPDLIANDAVLQTPPRTHQMELRQRRLSRRATISQKDGPDIVVEEWALLDPHDATNVSLRPFRRGKTYRIPPNLSQIQGKAQRIQKKQTKEAQDHQANEESEAPMLVRVRAPYFEEFDELYDTEMKRRRASIAAKRRPAEINNNNIPVNVVDADEGLRAEEALFEHPYAVVEDGAAFINDIGVVNNGESDSDDYGDNNQIGANEDGIGITSSSQQRNENNDIAGSSEIIIPFSTVEDTFASAMNEESQRLQQLQDEGRRLEERRRQELGLAARIAEWHSRLEPVIEAQEARHGFDIQECASELLETMRGDEGDDEESTETTSEGMKNRNVSFSNLVKGKEQWEICRYFLSTLLLMNCGNVEIEKKDPFVLAVRTTEERFDACNAFEEQQKQSKQKQSNDVEKEKEKEKEAPNSGNMKSAETTTDRDEGESEEDTQQNKRKNKKKTTKTTTTTTQRQKRPIVS